MQLDALALQAPSPLFTSIAGHWLTLLDAAWLGFVSWALWYRTRDHSLLRRRDSLLREELEAYLRFDPARHSADSVAVDSVAAPDASLPAPTDTRALARQVCRLVSDKSAFRRSALLLRHPDGRLYVAGSAGMDDLAVGVLSVWGNQFAGQQTPGTPPGNVSGNSPGGSFEGAPSRESAHSNSSSSTSSRSFVLDLPALPDLSPSPDLPVLPPGRLALRHLRGRAILLPLCTATDPLAGALAVSIDPHLPPFTPWTTTLEEAVAPLQSLALKLARAIESDALTARLRQAAGLSAQATAAADRAATQASARTASLATHLALEIAPALTAVLGFADLIASTAADPRVRDDAHSIVTQALRIRQVLEEHAPPTPSAPPQPSLFPLPARETA